MIPDSLLEPFTKYVESTIDEKGFTIPPAMFLDKEGKLHICALLGMEPRQILQFFWERVISGECVAIIASMDRYTKPDQGTEFADVLTLFCWYDDPQKPWQETIKVGVINYQYEPRIIRPIDWDNAHWNERLTWELNKTRPLFRIRLKTDG